MNKVKAAASSSLASDTAAQPDQRERFVLAPCARIPLPDDKVLVIRRRASARLAIPSPVLEVLSRCTRMRTEDGHVAAIAEALPNLASASTDVRSLLSAVRAAGLVITERELGRVFESATEPAPKDVRVVVGIVTCDRPTLLARALESVVTHHPGAPPPRLMVLDDSRDPSNAATNETLSRDAAAHHGIAVSYHGPGDQRRVVEGLHRALPDHRSAIDFLLGRYPLDRVVSHGRVMNHALLLSFGATLVRIDDDVLCRACAPPLAVVKTMRWAQPSREARFFRTDEERDACCVPRDEDPIAGLSEVTGRGLAELVADLRRRQALEARFDGITAADAEALLVGEHRVAVATCGLCGDPGAVSASWIFELSGDSLAHLVTNPERYLAALQDRNVWVGCDSLHFARAHPMLSPLHALDNSRPLPPFFPLFRGEDYLFGALLPLADPGGWFVELPWAVPHLPQPRRRWPLDLLDKPEELSFARFTRWAWGRHLLPARAGDAGRRLELLGGKIREMGEADSIRTRDEICGCLADRRSRLIRSLERHGRAGTGVPPWFERDVTHLIEVNRRAMAVEEPARMSDMSGHAQGADPVRWTLELWREYGTAMQAWPQILEAAGRLRDVQS